MHSKFIASYCGNHTMTLDSVAASSCLSAACLEWLSEQSFDSEHLSATGQFDDTPLIRACRRGEADIVAELLTQGADAVALNHRNMDGTNALWAAVVADSNVIADQLIDAGIDINNLNDNGASVLMYAASAGKTPWVEYLLGKGVDTRAETLDGFTALDLAANIECLRLLRKAA